MLSIITGREVSVPNPSIVPGVGPDAPTTTNESGGKQSAVPYRMDLMPPKATLEVSKVLAEGAKKYAKNNWKLIPVEDHLNHAIVHAYAYLAGDASDEHLAHFACRALMALEMQLEARRG